MDTVHVEQAAGRTEVRLAGRLVVSDVVNARRSLDAALRGGRPISLDGADVTGIDTAGLQLLAVFCASARGLGLGPEWRRMSAALRDAAALLGFGPLFNMAHASGAGPRDKNDA